MLRLLEAEEGRFALWLPIAALLGDALFFALRRDPPLWPGVVLLAAGAGASCVRRVLRVHAAGLIVMFVAFGFGAAQLAAGRAPPFVVFPTHAAAITGHIVAHDALPDGARLMLDRVAIDGRPIGPRQVRLRVDDDAALQPGAVVAGRARVDPPSPPAYPGGRDLQREAWFDGLAGYGYALGPITVTKPAHAGLLSRLRDHIAGRVRAVLPGPTGAIAAALLTGLSAAIPPADRTAFADAGLAHLLAIAGLHIGIVMGLALALSRTLLLTSERVALFWPVRQISAVCALLAGLGYLALTGVHVPTLRAFVMAALGVAALLAGRRVLSLRGWGVAMLIVIAVAPAEVTGASFQLSFAAVLALIAGYEALRAPLRRLRGEGGRLRVMLHHGATLVLTSLLAGLASLPFVAYHFARVQLYFVLANLIAVPATALWILPAGLAALALMPLGLDRVALVAMGWGLRGVLWLAHTVAGWPGATVRVPHMPLPALLAIAAGLAWLCVWRSRLRWAGLGAVAAGIAIAALVRPPDLLVAGDARLVGLRTPPFLLVRTARGGDAYVQAAWEQFLGLPSRLAAEASTCGPTSCLLQGPHTLPVRLGAADAPCNAPVLVAQAGGLPYCPGVLEVDRSATWRNGAAAIWLRPQPLMLTDRQFRGARSWVFLPPEQRTAGLGLPLAQAEALPPAPPSASELSSAASDRSAVPAP